VPIALAVSGPPSGFLLFSSDSWMGVECLVGLLDMPFCFEEISPCLEVSSKEKAGLEGEPCFAGQLSIELAVADACQLTDSVLPSSA
jgi:hypothetical protein